MGACGSRSKAELEAATRDAELTKQNYDDYMKQQQKIKLLLLGKVLGAEDCALNNGVRPCQRCHFFRRHPIACSTNMPFDLVKLFILVLQALVNRAKAHCSSR